MTQKRTATIFVWALVAIPIQSGGSPVFAGVQGRLTGRGSAVLAVSSGGQTTPDVGFTINFGATQDTSGSWKGHVSLVPTTGVVPVIIDGTTRYLARAASNVVDFLDGDVDWDSPTNYRLSVAGAVEVTDVRGGSHSFDGVLTVSGSVGGRGSAVGFSFAVGPGGQRGEISASGAWESGPGARASKTGSRNGLLKGMYSGELHGDREGEPYSAVLVIGFDGNGGITGGRISVGTGHHVILPTATPPPFDLGSYSVDADGFGDASFVTLADIAHPTGGDGVEHCVIAVADGGQMVKVSLETFVPFGPVLPKPRKVIGELVRQ